MASWRLVYVYGRARLSEDRVICASADAHMEPRWGARYSTAVAQPVAIENALLEREG